MAAPPIPPARRPFPDGRLALIVGVAIAVVFWPSVGHGFVYDDEEYVVENRRVLDGLTPGGAWWALTSASYASNWHPLTWLSLQLDATLFGPDPAGFHRTNVLLHGLAAGLTYLAVRRLTGAVWRSLVVALLFGLHPLRVESVSWVSERKDVLSGVFWMLTLLAYQRYTLAPSARRTAAVAAAFLLGLMAKPMLVTLPFVLLLLDAWPLGRLAGLSDLWPRVREKWPLFLLVAGSVAVTVVAQSRGGAVQGLDRVPLDVRLVGAPVAYAVYLGLTAWPLDLAPFYPIPPGGRPLRQPAAAVAMLFGVTAAGYVLRRPAPYLPVGWLWFIGTLVPVIGVVQVGGQAYADRYTYLPHVGLFLALVWGVADLFRRLRVPLPVSFGVAGIAITACVGLTLRQERFWANSEVLWDHALAVAPTGNTTAYSNLGAELMRQGREADALTQFRAASETARPTDPVADKARAKVALLSLNLGALGDAETAANDLLARPTAAPADRAASWFILGEVRRRRNEARRAEECYREAIRAEDGWNARLNLGLLLGEAGRRDEALEHLAAAQRLGPDVPECNHALGLALGDRNDWPAAIALLDRAVRGRPASGRYHGSLAMALLETGRPDPARQEAREAVRRDPGWLDWCYRTAWGLATGPDPAARDGAKAGRLAAVALLASAPSDPVLLDALAAGMAEAGRFDDAVRYAEIAARRADQAGRADLAADIQKRAVLYRSRQPYRAAP